MKKTTFEEFDNEGRLIKRTITEEHDAPLTTAPQWPWFMPMNPSYVPTWPDYRPPSITCGNTCGTVNDVGTDMTSHLAIAVQ